MKVLVTGGAGFIGSHIVDLLLERGHDVAVVDDLSTGNLANLNTGARFYHMSINDSTMKMVFTRERPDILCHQAAHTVVTDSVKDPVYDAQVNIIGSLNLLANCVRFGVRKVVFASSCAVYGNPGYLPVDEKHPVKPLSPYGIAKFAVEQYLRVYHEVHGLDYLALRYANVYGPRQNPYGEAGVVARFAKMMLDGVQPVIFGAGDKTRAYVFVADVAQANLKAIESSETGVYNIGTSEVTRDQTVFDFLSHELGYSGVPKYEPVRPGEITHMSLECTRAHNGIGWKPLVSFRDGISITASYYESLTPLARTMETGRAVS